MFLLFILEQIHTKKILSKKYLGNSTFSNLDFPNAFLMQCRLGLTTKMGILNRTMKFQYSRIKIFLFLILLYLRTLYRQEKHPTSAQIQNFLQKNLHLEILTVFSLYCQKNCTGESNQQDTEQLHEFHNVHTKDFEERL